MRSLGLCKACVTVYTTPHSLPAPTLRDSRVGAYFCCILRVPRDCGTHVYLELGERDNNTLRSVERLAEVIS